MQFHKFSEIFPLIEGADFDALVADIKEYGLREKIVVYQGKVLDGRNRFLACQKAKVRPLQRKFTGTDADALAFVISANMQRRHLTEAQRAMAAARIATLQKGANQHASRDASSQSNASQDALTQGDAAQQMDVSRSSVQRARKIIEKGSKALQDAVESGDVPLKKAASVVDLPKSEQLAAATKKPEPKPDAEDARWQPEDDEDERLAAIEREQEASLQKWIDADDKLAAANTEIKRLAAEVAILKISRDGYQNRCGEQARIIKSLRNKLAKTEKMAA